MNKILPGAFILFPVGSLANSLRWALHLHPCPRGNSFHYLSSQELQTGSAFFLQKHPLISRRWATWPHVGWGLWVTYAGPWETLIFHSNKFWEYRRIPVQLPLSWLACQQLDIAIRPFTQFRQQSGAGQLSTPTPGDFCSDHCTIPFSERSLQGKSLVRTLVNFIFTLSYLRHSWHVKEFFPTS